MCRSRKHLLCLHSSKQRQYRQRIRLQSLRLSAGVAHGASPPNQLDRLWSLSLFIPCHNPPGKEWIYITAAMPGVKSPGIALARKELLRQDIGTRSVLNLIAERRIFFFCIGCGRKTFEQSIRIVNDECLL